ncbi:TetR/AcrR family transcriptional regulator [Neptuniibacter halophilus]|uniref:TetR/AcrR family transcriptional regulator n=1 Tax=Neptuniibacter halophilus TaxID=651666 RepID=UPI00257468A5|nr:TetR/AcrR family transcriptional regulator [Neptuniibacter halophilus]
MGWSASQKQQSRERILQSAAELFTREGFENVGINDVMQHAGMTRGAFYNHFSSKSELYAEAILAAANTAKNLARANASDRKHLIEGYLSLQHREGDTLRCPLAFLTTDITQRDQQVRQTYTRVLKGFIHNIQQLDNRETTDEQEAIRQAVLMIGAVAISRAVDDDSYAEKLLNSCRDGLVSERR